MATILAAQVRVGDIVEMFDGEKILVKTARRVGLYVRFTAFGHTATECWYVFANSPLETSEPVFVVEQSNWEYVRTFVQLPLPFDQGVL